MEEMLENIPDFYADTAVTIAAARSRRSFRNPFLLLVSLAGCIAFWLVCLSMVPVTYAAGTFWSLTILTWLLTSAGCFLPKHLHLAGYLPLLLSGLLAFWKREQIVLGAKSFYNAYYSAFHHTETLYFETTADAADLTLALQWFLCCSSGVLCCLMVRSIVRHPWFLPYFLVSFLPIECGLYAGLPMNLPAIFVLLVTWFSVLAVRFTGRYTTDQPGKSAGIRSGTAATCGAAAALLTAFAVLLSFSVVRTTGLLSDSEKQAKRAELKQEIENFKWDDVPGSLSKLGITLGLVEDPEVRELGTKSQLHYKQEERLSLTVDAVPVLSMYLKNYTGSIYGDNMWRMQPEESWEETGLDVLFHRFGCAPQTFPFLYNQSLYHSYGNMNVTITPASSSDSLLMPYSAYQESASFADDSLCILPHKEPYSYTVSRMQNFYSITQLPIKSYGLSMDNFNLTDPTTQDFFQQLSVDYTQEPLPVTAYVEPYEGPDQYSTLTLQALLAENFSYRDYVYAHYLEFPDQEALEEVFAQLPGALLYNTQDTTRWETLRQIRTYLADQASYSLSPGITPSTRDFVNYFLLENQAGYCTHFATAGTVLARHFGIPARYCEGYVVAAERIAQISPDADGNRTITLEDADSHAWCEVYMDGYGWIPFEFTPGYYGEDQASPQDPDEFQEEQEEGATDGTEDTQPETEPATETEVITQSVGESTTTTTITTQADSSAAPDSNKTPQSGLFHRGIGKALAVVLVLAALLLLIWYARKIVLARRAKAFANPDAIAAMHSIYRYLVRLLSYHGITLNNQQLLEFSASAAAQLEQDGLDGAAVQEVLHLALAADMGGAAPEPEQVRKAVKSVQCLAEGIYDRNALPKRLVMKYFYHLL